MLSKQEIITDRVKLMTFLCFLPSHVHCGPNFHARLEFVDIDSTGCRDRDVKFAWALKGGQASANENVQHEQN